MILSNPYTLTIKEMATIFGVSKNQVRLALELGQVSSVTAGEHRFVLRTTVEKMLRCKLRPICSTKSTKESRAV